MFSQASKALLSSTPWGYYILIITGNKDFFPLVTFVRKFRSKKKEAEDTGFLWIDNRFYNERLLSPKEMGERNQNQFELLKRRIAI